MIKQKIYLMHEKCAHLVLCNDPIQSSILPANAAFRNFSLHPALAFFLQELEQNRRVQLAIRTDAQNSCLGKPSAENRPILVSNH